MIFSDSPRQRALERMMTAVPRFLLKAAAQWHVTILRTQQKCATVGTAYIISEKCTADTVNTK